MDIMKSGVVGDIETKGGCKTVLHDLIFLCLRPKMKHGLSIQDDIGHLVLDRSVMPEF